MFQEVDLIILLLIILLADSEYSDKSEDFWKNMIKEADLNMDGKVIIYLKFINFLVGLYGVS